MSTGILAATWLCLVLGQAPAAPETIYLNSRANKVPVNVPPALRTDILEMLLYASSDQGRTWPLVDRITPEKDGFAFYAPSDGVYWMRVARVNKQKVQEPSDKLLMLGPPNQIIVIDTLKPIIRTIKAQRDGEDVYVNWDVQEENPDRAGMRMEYQVKDSPSSIWTPVTLQNTQMQGQTKFRPTSNQALVIRLTVRDLAGNESYAEESLAGTVAAASYTNPPIAVQTNNAGGPSLPVEIQIPRQPAEPMNVIAPPSLPAPPQVDHKVLSPGPIAPPQLAPTEKMIADSTLPPPPPETPKVAQGGLLIPPPGLDPLPMTRPGPPTRKALPEIKYVNRHQVMLQYELKRVGPSGIGGIQIWLTKDDGETWKPYAEVKDLQSEATTGRQERNFEFRDDDGPFADGVYGMILVVKNRAGLGRIPKAGDVPEIRVEIDTKVPIAQLAKPMPDPQRPDHVLFKWFAEDRNLDFAPITLEYAEKRDGPWLPIQSGLDNKGRYTNRQISGDFSWKVPANFPVQVYLRLRVRDKAGNESVAVSAQPEYLDLMEPEGILTGVQAK